MQRCCHCHGRFGLVSHRYLSKRFCSRKCLSIHKRDLHAALAERAGRWCSLLSTSITFGHADRAMKMSAVAGPLRKRTAKV
jgi:hypothetical protein